MSNFERQVVSFIIMAILPGFGVADNTHNEPKTIPAILSRLSIARTYASNDLDTIQNLFDANPTTMWVSHTDHPWVRLTFIQPVTVEGITIGTSDAANAPNYYELHLRHADRKVFLTYPLVQALNPESKYALPHPVANVDEVWLTFLGKGPVNIDSVAIYGEPPKGIDPRPTIPSLDPTGPAFVKELQRIERRAMRRDFEKF